MGNLLPNTTTDFNLTNNFGAGDLDIGWAHLQVMKLWELSPNDTITIDGSQFELKNTAALRNAIQKIYDVNIAGGIASDSLGDVYNPPEMFTSETYTKIWRLNDIFEPGRGGQSPTDTHTSVYESVSGTYSGTITGDHKWARKNKSDKYLHMYTGTTLTLDDDRAIGFPYSIAFSFYMEKSGDLVILRKGEFYIHVKNSYVHLKKVGSSKYNSFRLPNDQTHTDLKNRWVEFRMIAYKIPDLSTGSANPTYKVFIDNKECERTKFSLNNVISSKDVKEPFIFTANPVQSVRNFRISNSTLSFPVDSEDFAFDHSLDLASSFNYKIFENELIDNAGNKMPIVGFPGVNNQHKSWLDKPSTSNSSVGSPVVQKVAEPGGGRKIVAPQIDISKDFTISFWFRANTSADDVVLFDSVDADNNKFSIYLDTGKISVKFPLKTYSLDSSIPFTADWTHLVAIKSGELFGLYINGSLAMWKTVVTKIGSATTQDLIFGGDSKNSTRFYLSQIKILKYAIHHIEVSGWENVDVDNKIERLMLNNF